MKKNVGGIDQKIRYVIGSILILIGLFIPMSTELRAIIFVVAAIALLTGFFGL